MAGIDSYVKLLLHGDGTNGSQTITDSELAPTKTVTAVSTAQISTVSPKFGTGSILFNGSSDYLTAPYSSDWFFGTADFTIDCWVKPDTTNTGCLVSRYKDASNYWAWGISAGGGGFFYLVVGGLTKANYTWSTQSFAGLWNHLEVSRYGTTMNMFQNGDVCGKTEITAIAANSIPDFSTTTLQIGKDSKYFYCLKGYLDELRVSKGMARHTTYFTPPTTAYAIYTWELSFADSVTLSDAIAKNIRLPKSDSMTIVDTFSRAVAFHRSFAESITVTDVISKLYEKNTTDSVTLADVLSKVASYNRSFSEGLTLSDNFNITKPGEYFLSFSETLSLVDAISKQIDLPLADAISLADEISWASTFNRTLSDSLTLTDSMADPVIITLLTLTIQSSPIIVGQQKQVTVMGLFSDGSVQDVTSYCQFVSSHTELATIDSAGLVTGIATGLTIITATIGSVTTNYTLAILPERSTVIPQNGIVAFADGKTYRNATYLSRRYEYKLNSIGVIKVLSSQYPVMVDLIFPDIPYTISVIVVSKKPQRVKAFLSEAVEVRINPAEEVSAVFLASSLSELNI